LRALAGVKGLVAGVVTCRAAVMREAAQAGAAFIIDPLALEGEGSLEAAYELRLPVCLMYHTSEDVAELDNDPVARVTEFFYARVDACIGAGIPAKRLIIDPAVPSNASLQARLTILGKMKSFRSFALPISVELPGVFPIHDDRLGDSMIETVSASLYAVQMGINVLRTPRVEELAHALDVWQSAAMHTKPFRLSRALIARWKRLRWKREGR
nr:dihydropteroate synthase [Succinivibrionaceae bacterium]